MIGPLTYLNYYYAMMKLAKVDSITHRGTSRGLFGCHDKPLCIVVTSL